MQLPLRLYAYYIQLRPNLQSVQPLDTHATIYMYCGLL